MAFVTSASARLGTLVGPPFRSISGVAIAQFPPTGMVLPAAAGPRPAAPPAPGAEEPEVVAE